MCNMALPDWKGHCYWFSHGPSPEYSTGNGSKRRQLHGYMLFLVLWLCLFGGEAAFQHDRYIGSSYVLGACPWLVMV